MRTDDCSLTPDQYRKVREQANKLLVDAGAVGRFPTPIADLMEAAKVVVAPENALDEGFLQKLRRKAGNALKQALSKVMGIFDAKARLVFVDTALGESKQSFIKLHEAGHGVLPWQSGLYAVIEDCEKSLWVACNIKLGRARNLCKPAVVRLIPGRLLWPKYGQDTKSSKA